MRKIIPVIAAGAGIVALVGGTAGYAVTNKAVTLSIDGQTREVKTGAGTVADLLQNEGLDVGQHDVVAPAPTTKLSEGSRVAIKFGRQVTFSVDGKPQTIWTTATTVDQAIAASGLDTSDAQLSTSRSSAIGREGLEVGVATEKEITVALAGKKKTITTHARTVGEVLTAAQVRVDGDDKLTPAATTAVADGLRISYTKVDVKTKNKKETVGYRTVRKESDQVAKGVTKVTTPGKAGSKVVSYRIVRHNDEIVSTKAVRTRTIKKPTAQIVVVGTKVPKVASVASGSVWDRLAQCESGGNWSINTGNGFYGGLQFTASTWRAYGGSGMPHTASREQQIAIASKVQKGQGWGAWPACTSKLGIR